MKRPGSVLALGVLAASCFGCSTIGTRDPKVSLKDARLDALIYDGPRPSRQGTLPANSVGAVAIEELLAKKRGHWKSSLVSYVPNVYVRSEDFSINLMKGLIIINSAMEPGRKAQVVSDLTADEFERASRAVSGSMVDDPQKR
ncbi:MAG TPA: hypothetical protein VGH33_27000 [Isosphaeraceae bacterium]